MTKGAVEVEESRLVGLEDVSDYQIFRERHRVFPAIFEDRKHSRILDSSAGVGCVAKRIKEKYPSFLVGNDISPTCLELLKKIGVTTVSFDLDVDRNGFPFPDKQFDAVISLVTLEHIFHVDKFVKEINRILTDDGFLYMCTPNYSAPENLIRPVLFGRTIHNPLYYDTYEFYAHIRYFTYRTFVDFVSAFGFVPDTVYLTLPEASTAYLKVFNKNRLVALAYRYVRWLQYAIFSAPWASEPIVCFQKSSKPINRRLRKVIL